jgi:ATP synthase mitochondrial F1 complex assembly factor 2
MDHPSLRPTVSQTLRVIGQFSLPTPGLLGAEATLTRFWKTVGIDYRGDAYTVTLDQRPLKTPAGNTMMLPKGKALLATLIAYEWAIQDRLLKPHALPMVLVYLCLDISYHSSIRQTSLASRAIDAMGREETRAEVRASLLEYLDTDTVWLAVSSLLSH